MSDTTAVRPLSGRAAALEAWLALATEDPLTFAPVETRTWVLAQLPIVPDGLLLDVRL